MHYINNLNAKLKHLINYFHYYVTVIFKNVYPYRFIGECLFADGYQVKIKLAGKNQVYIVNVSDFLTHSGLIEHFCPLDALQIGKILFKHMIFNLKEGMRVLTFCDMKEKLVAHSHSAGLSLEKNTSNRIHLPEMKQIRIRNFYPFKLVALKTRACDFNTMVIYSSTLNKREGYEKSLMEIIQDNTFLAKFNPMTAMKLGFISFGDTLFANGEI